MTSRRGFTLIELLVVIAIIAILAVVVVLTLNPAQLLAQSRDANRVYDPATLNRALTLYETDLSSASTYSLGTSSVTYVSTPDATATTTAGTDCTNEGFLTGGYFHCDAISTNRNVNGSGWIPVNFSGMSAGSPFGSMPVDPVNSTSSDLYYRYETNGSTYLLMASPESQKYIAQAATNHTMFTQGTNFAFSGGKWVLVPGNSQFGTGNFYAMKYDASCINMKTGAAFTSPLDGTGYSNSAQNCSTANGFAPSSLATGNPIVDVSQTQAEQYCASIGAHLMTNNEWQTIAWNAENVASNWSGGSVGSGYMYSGHNDNVPPNASVASANDAQNCVGTDGPSSCGGTGTNTSQIRTLTLSDGSVVWDMAGNLWQWTSDTIIGTNEPHSGLNAWFWTEYPSITTWGSMTQASAGPANSTWSTTQGIGEILSENSSTDSTEYGFIRGGFWYIGAWYIGGVAGVETLNLSTTPSSTSNALGFRCTR